LKRLLYLTALVTAGTAGCLTVPGTGQPPMCETTSDCDQAAGEICAEGVCWGDPPAGIYAARIGPPGNRNGLVPTEITRVDIAANGWFTTDLRLEKPVTVSGSVTLDCGQTGCSGPAIASTITVSRPSRIPGGPPFVAVAHTTEDSSAFTIAVPRGETGEDYSVVVSPDRANASRIDLDEVAPARVMIQPTDNVANLDVALGSRGRTVTGVVLDRDGSYLPGALVVVRGRWVPEATTIDISSIATTDALGMYTVYLPQSTIDPVAELQITPLADPGELRPTLLAPLDLAPGEIVTLPALKIPNLGATANITIPIMGTSATGVVTPIADADVRIVAEQEITNAPNDPFVARVDVGAKTGPDGMVHLQVLTATSLSYQLHVKPPSASGVAFATVYGATLDVTAGPTLPAILLANQVSVRGALYDHSGHAAEGVVVTVVPNAAYAAQLSGPLQEKLNEVVATSETTNSSGQFAVFVDPDIGGLAAQYDVMFEAPQHSLLPSWQKQGLTVDRTSGYDLQDLDLPEASYVRGPVVDPDDQPIEGAEVRLYEIPSSILPCARVSAPADDPSCAQKAILRAHGQSDSGGEVHLVLPDP